MKNDAVLKKIRASQNRARRRNEVTLDRTISELKQVAFFDFSRVFDRKGNLLPPDKMPADVRRAIDRLEFWESVKGGRRVRTLKMVKVADRTAALDTSAKLLGMLPQ
ncbi:MAG: terminase small subunit [Candidatus Binataceae bacterium]